MVDPEFSRYLNSYSQQLTGNSVSFNIHYWGSMLHDDHPVHKHAYFELCYVTSGSGTYHDDGTCFALTEGSMFLSRPGMWHRIQGGSEHGIGLIYVAFELEAPAASEHVAQLILYLMSPDNVYFKDAREIAMGKLWSLLSSMATPQTSLPEEILPSLSYSLLAALLEHCAAPYHQGRQLPVSAAVQETSLLLHQAKLYIRDNISLSIRSKELAAYLHISQRHLIRLFTSELNRSPSQYIREERIRIASHLLKTSLLTVQEVAEITGFSSIHHFTRLFKEVKGLPPGLYRRNGAHSSGGVT
ncbi:helix-turn-helix domain-containing protein [Paenibacillus sp. JSM ZJ436]|uniref:helix-turn-helix domain-containing protein n=1 Tax=Paenibacillus sp. JSM ZJ436 TaxID=3376190 RepID=UPI0037AE3846